MIETKRNWYTLLADLWQILRLAYVAKPRLSILSILFSSVQAVLPAVSAWLLKFLLDGVVSYFATPISTVFRAVVLLTIAYVVAGSLQKLLIPIDQFFKGELRRAISLKICGDVYEQTLRFEGIAYLEDPQYHDLQTVSGQSVQNAPFVIADGLTTLVQSVSVLVSFLGLLIILSPLLTVLVFLSIIPNLFVQLRFGRDRFKLAFDLSPLQRESSYLAYTLTGLPAAKEVRLFGLQSYLLDKWKRITERSNQAESNLQRQELGWKIGLELLAFVGTGFAYYFIVRGIFNQQLTVGDIALYGSAVSGVQMGILSLVRAIAQVSEIHLFFAQYDAIRTMSQPIEVADEPEPTITLQHAITFQNVWFRYSDESAWVLRGVSFTLPVNQCVALVGVNGAGKSTLIKLITRLYDPTHGHIFWDGVDIQAFAVSDYRQQLSTVFQDFMRFQLPVWENIGMGNMRQINQRDTIQQAAQKAEIADHIDQLEHGYDTHLSRWLSMGEKGTDLSGGEWQRIAIARSFMRDSDLLLLDEPTAALDAETEQRVVKLFEQLKTGRTSLLISHRFSTVKLADRIVVLADGAIIERGTHAELITLDSTYARMYYAQADLFAMNDNPQVHPSAKSDETNN